MIQHWRYGRYVLRHKWFVFLAGLKRGVPIHQLILHDWTKFLPSEWMPYAEWFYGAPGGGSWYPRLKEIQSTSTTNEYELAYRVGVMEKYEAFMSAFLLHLHRSPHHWQYWVLTPDAQDKPAQSFAIPDRYLREMLADWDGAGRAITGKTDTRAWYERQGPATKLHPSTRAHVERLLGMAS